MRCGLKRLVGFPADCETHRCVFWRDDTIAHGENPGSGCVLEEFKLTGTVADRLTLWLLEYKISHDRASIEAASQRHSDYLGARMGDRSDIHRSNTVRRQNSSSCASRPSIVA